MSKLSKFFKKPGLFWRDYLIKRYQEPIKFRGSDDKLCFDFLISGLKKEGFSGIYYSPLGNEGYFTLCILKKQREVFIKDFFQYAEKNGFEISIKINRKVKKLTSSSGLRLSVLGKKFIDIRLSKTRNIGIDLNDFYFRVEFWQEYEDFYKTPKDNYISIKLWKSVSKKHGFFEESSLRDYSSVLKYPHESSVNLDIDLVFTWVNFDDTEWKKMYKKHSPNSIDDASSTSRFLSRNELKYSLRSWFIYGSFIRNIYIVSNCKPPEWLNLEHNNITWVFHEEILPQNALPTFSSHAIEASLHKITGLSNYFIYCNDDVFLGKPAQASDFYYSNGIAKIRLEAYGNVNGEVTKEHPDYLNAARNSNRLLEESFKKTTTQLHTHSPSSLRVDMLTEMNSKYLSYFDDTISNRFRSTNDINVPSFFAPHYSLLTGRALQSDVKVDLIQQGHNYTKQFKSLIALKKAKQFGELPLSFCINDGGDSHLNDDWNDKIVSFLEEYFPEKSDFEI